MSTTSEDTLYGGVRVINVPGIQGPRGSDGTVAPEAVIVAQNIQSVNAVAAVATEVGAVGRNISNLSTVAGSISSVETVGNNVTNVVTVANASTAVTSVAADLTNINAVAADLTNIDAASGHAQTASTKAAEATAIVTEFDAHALEKQGVFDSNASTKTSAFNTNATSKTSDFNSNASTKTTAFDSNATSKTTAFDSNASTKTTTFNTNATSKTTEFDSHVTTKTTAFDAHVEEKKALIDASVEEASGYATTASGKATEAGTHAASAKTYAIGDPAEPSSGHSAKWYSEHMALSYKGPYAAATTYNVNEFVSSASSGVTSFYISLVNSNTGNPLSDTTKWGLLFTITQGGSISWGYIQGTLSDQTDLSAALAGKQTTISDLETIRSGAALGTTAVQPDDISDMATKTWTGAQGYLTEHQSLSAYRTSADQDTIDAGKQATISDLAAIRTGAGLGATAVQPDAISDMATKTWTGAQGYLTEHQSLSAYRTSADQDTIDSGKQATISDLADIRTGAGLGATAVQPSAITDMATKTWVGSQNFLTSTSTLDATKLSGTASISTTGNAATATTATDYAAGGGIATALSGKQATISDLSDIRTGAALGATAQQPATTLSGYGITDASISNGVITLGSNTITPLTSHQDITGKVNVSGSRGSLAGYCTSGSAASIDASSSDCNEVSANVALSDGASGTSWTKIVRLTAAVTVTLGSGWSWVGGSAPTIAAGGILVCCWCGSGGMVNYASPS